MLLTPEQQQIVESIVPHADKLAGKLCPGDDEARSVAYLAVCEAITRYDPDNGASVKTYCLGCARRAVMNYRQDARPVGVKRKKSERVFLTNPERLPSFDGSFADVDIEDLLSVLRPSDREVFRRVVFENERVAVIMKERNCSDTVIYRTLARCKERLRREIDG